MLSSGATGSIILSPQGNYTVFQSPNPAVFTCSGYGIIAVWTLNGTSSTINGVTITPYDPTLGAVVPSHLSIIPNANYNNTQVACGVVTYQPTLRFLQSSPTLLIIQGEDLCLYLDLGIAKGGIKEICVCFYCPFSFLQMDTNKKTDFKDRFHHFLFTYNN